MTVTELVHHYGSVDNAAQAIARGNFAPREGDFEQWPAVFRDLILFYQLHQLRCALEVAGVIR